MVESIKPLHSNKAQSASSLSAHPRTDTDLAGDTDKIIQSSSLARPEAVSVKMESADSARKLAENAPIDIDLVNQIRQRVADGEYPIDAAAIAEKMFSSIKDG